MSAVRKTLTVLAMTTLITLGFAGTSHADISCEWVWDGAGAFYCQQA
ncbi:hypothetical protein M5362_32010 [Streptomyces sp. Je 1-79]|nr:hypothetical protein [Streptomyces sp. Je 1-79]MCT4357732.1 hypothetical protein [Streptomyces sp. Je 1-79]